MMTTLTSSRVNDIHKKMVFRYIWEKEQVSANLRYGPILGLVNRHLSGYYSWFRWPRSLVKMVKKTLLWEETRNFSQWIPRDQWSSVFCLKDLGDVEVAIVDLKGTILSRESFTLLTKEPPQAAVDEIAWFVNAALAKFPHTTCLSISLGAPERILSTIVRELNEYSAHFGWKNSNWFNI